MFFFLLSVVFCCAWFCACFCPLYFLEKLRKIKNTRKCAFMILIWLFFFSIFAISFHFRFECSFERDLMWSMARNSLWMYPLRARRVEFISVRLLIVCIVAGHNNGPIWIHIHTFNTEQQTLRNSINHRLVNERLNWTPFNILLFLFGYSRFDCSLHNASFFDDGFLCVSSFVAEWQAKSQKIRNRSGEKSVFHSKKNPNGNSHNLL